MELLDLGAREEWVRARLRERSVAGFQTPLSDRCLALEELLETLLVESVVDELHRTLPQSEFRSISPVVFEFREKRFEARCARDTVDPSVLVVAVAEIGTGSRQPHLRSPRIQLAVTGRYTGMEIVTGDDHTRFHDMLGQLGKAVMEAGGRWIEQFVMLEIDALMRHTAEGLYSIIRAALPPSLTSRVWLYSVDHSRGIYLSDPINRNTALVQTAERSVQLLESPIQHVVEFTTHVLDPTKGFVSHVIAGGSTIEVDVSKAMYSYKFELAEESVFHTSKLVGQPLVREGKVALIAAYPVELRASVEPVLETQRLEFRRVIEQSANKLRSSLRALTSYTAIPSAYGKLGEFVGGMIKQLVQP